MTTSESEEGAPPEAKKEAGAKKKKKKDDEPKVGAFRQAAGHFLLSAGTVAGTFWGSLAVGFGAGGIATLFGADHDTATTIGVVAGLAQHFTNALVFPLVAGASVALQQPYDKMMGRVAKALADD